MVKSQKMIKILLRLRREVFVYLPKEILPSRHQSMNVGCAFDVMLARLMQLLHLQLLGLQRAPALPS